MDASRCSAKSKMKATVECTAIDIERKATRRETESRLEDQSRGGNKNLFQLEPGSYTALLIYEHVLG